MLHANSAGYVSKSNRESSHELDTRCPSVQVRRENKELKEHVERLQILLIDVSVFEQEKRTMMEAFHQSCAREQELKERLKEEEKERECIEDMLGDLRYIKGIQERRQLRFKDLKQAVFTAKCVMEDMQHALIDRDDVIRRRNLEIVELVNLQEDCFLHAEETAKLIGHAKRQLGKREHTRTHGTVPEVMEKMKRKKTPPAAVRMVHGEVSDTRVQDKLITLCSFSLTLFFLLLIFSFVIPEEVSDITFPELIADSVKSLLAPFITVHHTDYHY
ncbi:uncharacterized protein LOC125145305 [Tachysurus fulvidraco]|uniref:uncharacterized protein LOC125145305 n=1 Tax=Tachysurus fulvidraco TaxID=1234273 RepID=UPI001FEDFAB6|nr:uncharacterized protein LOC125145305 [Tachysurus fulvidraco]